MEQFMNDTTLTGRILFVASFFISVWAGSRRDPFYLLIGIILSFISAYAYYALIRDPEIHDKVVARMGNSFAGQCVGLMFAL